MVLLFLRSFQLLIGQSKETTRRLTGCKQKMMVSSDKGGSCGDRKATLKVPRGAQNKTHTLKADFEDLARENPLPTSSSIPDIPQNNKPSRPLHLLSLSPWKALPSNSWHLLISNVFCSKRPSLTTQSQQPAFPLSQVTITNSL